MTVVDTIAPATVGSLYDRHWPPVRPFSDVEPEFAEFLGMGADGQRAFLADRRGDREAQGAIIHSHLAEIYAYVLGYEDSACARVEDDRLEIELLRAKIVLERELLSHWLMTPVDDDGVQGQEGAAGALEILIADNPGVEHPLFRYIEEEADRRAIETFLQCEVVRNEVVDDEVALLVVGLQGKLKAVAAANLWDECGHGKLRGFHTFWLRRLLNGTDGWDRIVDYRSAGQPWFSRITSNLNGALLTRPTYKLGAYGCFLVFESWVAPHFRRVLRGMERVGLDADDIRVYFDAHVRIDPMHSSELLEGIREQRPALSTHEVDQLMTGASLAVAAGSAQYDRMLPYLRSLT